MRGFRPPFLLVTLVIAICACFARASVCQSTPQAAPASRESLPSVIALAVPVYAPIAQSLLLEGEVVLRVSTDGDSVLSIENVRGSGLLANSAKSNISTWKFEHHRPRVFETTFRYRLLPAFSDEKGSVVLRLPAEVEVTAPRPTVYEILDVVVERSTLSIAESCGRSNVVAEVVALRRGDARLDPRFTNPNQPQPLTPTTVRVERVFKTSGSATASAGQQLAVLEPYGEVKTPSMIGRRRGESAFALGSPHFAFLECNADGECTLGGPALRISGQTVTGALEPAELAQGADRLRKALQACAAADRR